MTRYRRWPNYQAWRWHRSGYRMALMPLPRIKARAMYDDEVEKMFGPDVLQDLQYWRRLL